MATVTTLAGSRRATSRKKERIAVKRAFRERMELPRVPSRSSRNERMAGASRSEIRRATGAVPVLACRNWRSNRKLSR